MSHRTVVDRLCSCNSTAQFYPALIQCVSITWLFVSPHSCSLGASQALLKETEGSESGVASTSEEGPQVRLSPAVMRFSSAMRLNTRDFSNDRNSGAPRRLLAGTDQILSPQSANPAVGVPCVQNTALELRLRPQRAHTRVHNLESALKVLLSLKDVKWPEVYGS